MNLAAQAFAGRWSSAWSRTETVGTTSMSSHTIRAVRFNGEMVVRVVCGQGGSGQGNRARHHVNTPHTGIGSALCAWGLTVDAMDVP